MTEELVRGSHLHTERYDSKIWHLTDSTYITACGIPCLEEPWCGSNLRPSQITCPACKETMP